MTDQPSEAALDKARALLGFRYPGDVVDTIARHFDEEDKAAREAIDWYDPSRAFAFARRHILPDPAPTLEQVIAKAVPMSSDEITELAQALRDAGLLREG